MVFGLCCALVDLGVIYVSRRSDEECASLFNVLRCREEGR